MNQQIKNWVVIKLFRNGYVGRRLLDFDDFGKKINKKILLGVLKELQKESIIIKKSSQRSGKGRFSLNLKMKSKWEKIAIDSIMEG